MKSVQVFLTLLFIGAFNYISAQVSGEKALKYANTITAEELNQHLQIIASDKFEGRETGKKGQKMAMEYLIKNFKSYGIEDPIGLDYIQTFPLIEQKSEGIRLVIDNEEYSLNKDYAISPSVIQNTSISGEVVFIGYGMEDENWNDYEGLNVEGKAVFLWNGNPKKKLKEDWDMPRKIQLAREKGATAILYYDDILASSLLKYEHYFNRPSTKLVDDVKGQAPVVRLTKSPANQILKTNKLKVSKIAKKGIKKGKSFSCDFSLSINKPTKQLTGENVIAFIEGKEKSEEVIVLTAHYDHIGKEDSLIFNGADDDGTGTVSLLEIAQAFSQAVENGDGPRRSVLIMPVSGEEKGLLGSKYYTNHPIFPLENTVANLNIDMIGRYDENHKEGSNYVYLIGSDKLSSELHAISEEVNETYMNIDLDYTFNDENDPNRFYYRSDHYNFAKNGIPVIFYFSGVHEDYHKATDTVEKIDFDKTERIARLVFLTAWELANREGRIAVDQKKN